MSEPSSGVPSEIADADIEPPVTGTDEPEQVDLHVDEEKLEAWDDIKSDYQVDPDGEVAPNSMETSSTAAQEAGGAADDGADEDADGYGDDEGETKETSAIPG